jgi:hypothetical protein
MKQLKYQRGATPWTLLMGLAALGIVVFTALKLFPVYMQDFSVGSSVEGLESDPQEFHGPMSIRVALGKRFGINNVDQAGLDDISVTRNGQYYLVEVDYDVVIPYMANISLLLNFNHQASVPVRE